MDFWHVYLLSMTVAWTLFTPVDPLITLRFVLRKTARTYEDYQMKLEEWLSHKLGLLLVPCLVNVLLTLLLSPIIVRSLWIGQHRFLNWVILLMLLPLLIKQMRYYPTPKPSRQEAELLVKISKRRADRFVNQVIQGIDQGNLAMLMNACAQIPNPNPLQKQIEKCSVAATCELMRIQSLRGHHRYCWLLHWLLPVAYCWYMLLA